MSDIEKTLSPINLNPENWLDRYIEAYLEENFERFAENWRAKRARDDRWQERQDFLNGGDSMIYLPRHGRFDVGDFLVDELTGDSYIWMHDETVNSYGWMQVSYDQDKSRIVYRFFRLKGNRFVNRSQVVVPPY